MIKNTTFSDLLAYAYNETGLTESDRIQRQIDGDPVTLEAYNDLHAVLNLLSEATPEISPASLKRILEFC
jgi:hypothetical protein